MFSVVIPLYNKSSHIVDSVNSVLSQTFKNFEVIIVDDGSTDSSSDLIKKIKDPRLRIIRQDNSGVSAARNNGVRAACRKYVAFLDADDFWYEDHLERMQILIDKFPTAGLYATAYDRVLPSGDVLISNDNDLIKNQEQTLVFNYFESCVKFGNLVWTSACCIPREMFVEQGIWFPLGEKFGEDLHVWARIGMNFSIAYDIKPSAIYMMNSENNTLSASLSEPEPHKAILSLSAYRDSIGESERRYWFDKYYESQIFNVVVRNLWAGNLSLALKQTLEYGLGFKSWMKLVIAILLPRDFYGVVARNFRSVLGLVRASKTSNGRKSID